MEKIWNFSDAKFHLLMGSVYGTLQQKFASEPGWAELYERYDSDSLEMLRIFLAFGRRPSKLGGRRAFVTTRRRRFLFPFVIRLGHMLLVGRSRREPIVPCLHVGVRRNRVRPRHPTVCQRARRDIRHGEFIATEIRSVRQMRFKDVIHLCGGFNRRVNFDRIPLILGQAKELI